MLYRLIRAVVGFALTRFYRVVKQGAEVPAVGPVMLVGNHPNALMDPALIFAAVDRPITFLAKAPLFKMPGLGALLRGIGALPVYRKQDDPGQMGRNEGTLDAAAQALAKGGVITLFPEGKSHSEPQLAELKTGAARIAFKALAAGGAVKVVPVGLTYEKKDRFRSLALLDVGVAISVQDFFSASPQQEGDAVRALTAAIAEGLKAVTLNLERWEDLPLIETAEALYALRRDEPAEAPARRRRFARGLQLFRAEQPGRYEQLRAEVASLRRRLRLVRATPEDLPLLYQPGSVAKFVGRNLLSLMVGFPLFALGMGLFSVPFLLGRLATPLVSNEHDVQSTVKFLAALVLGPLWLLGLGVLGGRVFGVWVGLGTLLLGIPLGLFTRYFYEHRRAALRDIRVFFILGSRATLKARLLAEGEVVARNIEAVAEELGARLTSTPTGARS